MLFSFLLYLISSADCCQKVRSLEKDFEMVALYVFDKSQKSPLYSNQITLFLVYVFDSVNGTAS